MNYNSNRRSIENFIINEIHTNDKDIIIKNGVEIYINADEISKLLDINKNVVINLINEMLASGELSKDFISFSVEKDENDFKKVEKYYNLQAVISISYRINTEKSIGFRKWGSNILSEYAIKGYVLNKKILSEEPTSRNKLEKEIKEIRNEEKDNYERLRNIYSKSTDYDSSSLRTKNFYSQMQNKMIYAITGLTAAEIIFYKSDSSKRHMGLETWKNSPDGNVTKSDIGIAKNYLTKSEIHDLELLTSMFLDFSEYLAEKNEPMTMSDWAKKLDEFLKLSSNKMLKNNGSIMHDYALYKAEDEYSKFDRKSEYFLNYFLLNKERLPYIEKKLIEIKKIYDNLSEEKQKIFFKSTSDFNFDNSNEKIYNWINNNYLGIIELSDRNQIANWICKSKEYFLNSKKKFTKNNQKKVKLDELRRLKNAINTLGINDNQKLTSKDIENINEKVVKGI